MQTPCKATKSPSSMASNASLPSEKVQENSIPPLLESPTQKRVYPACEITPDTAICFSSQASFLKDVSIDA